MRAPTGAAAQDDVQRRPSPLADNHLEGTQALPVSMLGNPDRPTRGPTRRTTGSASSTRNWQHAFDADTMLAANAYYRQLSTSGVNSNVNGEYAPPDQPTRRSTSTRTRRHARWGASMQLTLQRALGGDRAPVRRGRRLRRRQHGLHAKRAAGDVRRRPRHHRHRRLSRTQTDVTRRTGRPASMRPTRWRSTPQWTLSVRRPLQHGARRDTGPDGRSTGDQRHATRSAASIPPSGVTWTPERRSMSSAASARACAFRRPSSSRAPIPRRRARCPTSSSPIRRCKPVRRDDVRDRRARPRRRGQLLQRRDLPHGSRRRHPVHRRGQRRRQRGLFPERRQYAAPGRRAHRRHDAGRRSRWSRATASSTPRSRPGFAESSPNNSTANAEGLIYVQPGNRLPGLPRNAFRLRADWEHGPFALGATLRRVRVRNTRAATRTTPTRQARSRAMRVVAVDATWQIARRLAAVRAHRQPVQPDIPEFRHPRRQLFPRTRQHVRRRPRRTRSRFARPARRSAPGSASSTGSTAARGAAKLRRPQRCARSPALSAPISRRRMLQRLAALGASVGDASRARRSARAPSIRRSLCRAGDGRSRPLSFRRTRATWAASRRAERR